MKIAKIENIVRDTLWLFSDPHSILCLSGVESQFESAQVRDKPKRVLVIDDEVLVADSLTEILSARGFEARAFYRGQEAIEFARAYCPDVVLSDVLMPKLNGVDTVLAIRELCPKMRILLFSGQAGTADILAKARSKGIRFELLPKPLHPDELLRRLAQFWSA